jgi:rare lipoprotein A
MIRRALPLTVVAVVVGCSQATRWEKPAPPPAGTTPVVNEPGQPPRSAQGNPAFYEVFGRRYYVLPTSGGYREQGIASWYGRKFHGKPTSSGEPYNMHALTAAHKTLPLPTRVRVTNLQNQRNVVVTVNDRGPFVDNRLIDLSYAAALELDMVRDGTAMVAVEVLPYDTVDQPPTVAATASGAPSTMAAASAPLPLAKTLIFLQVGAFGEAGNAERLKAQLENGGLGDVLIHYETAGEQPLYRVRVGPIADVAEYDRLIDRVATLNIRDAHLVTARPGG